MIVMSDIGSLQYVDGSDGNLVFCEDGGGGWGGLDG